LKSIPTNVEQIASRHLCVGCGACAGLFPQHIEMVDTVDHARRPRVIRPAGKLGGIAKETLSVCPGNQIEFKNVDACPGADSSLFDEWGPVLEVWEGYAADSELQFRGSRACGVRCTSRHAKTSRF
jgi:coenzyme F420 hydrogenase subunit beta